MPGSKLSEEVLQQTLAGKGSLGFGVGLSVVVPWLGYGLESVLGEEFRPSGSVRLDLSDDAF